MTGTLAFAGLAALGFTLALSLIMAGLSPTLERMAARRAPAARARWYGLLAAAPTVGGVLLMVLCFLPALATLAGLADDHCLDHDDAHLHFCFVHLAAPHGWAAWSMLAGGGLAMLAAVVHQTRRLWKTRALLASLGPLSHTDQVSGAGVIPSPIPLALAAGLFKPRIYVSTAVVEALPADQLDAVVEHERAHVARRDGVWRAIVELLSTAHVPAVRRRLLAAFELACEQACDEAAAARVGDRLSVASAIVTMERMCRGVLPAGAGLSSIGGSNVEARVTALLGQAAPPHRRWMPASVIAVLAVALAVAAADPLHHVTETLLSFLAH
jgi:Zn-dependent protease with chaperone function